MKPLFLIMNISAILIFSTTSSSPIDDADDNSIDVPNNGTLTSKLAKCNDDLTFSPDEFVIFTNGTVYILTINRTLEKFQYTNIDDKLCIVDDENHTIVDNENHIIVEQYLPILDCESWYYEPKEFSILKNGSVLLLDFDNLESDSDPLRGIILENGTYEIEGDRLKTCVDEHDHTNDSSRRSSRKADNENHATTKQYYLTILNCESWYYEPTEFSVLKNGSVLLLDFDILENSSTPLRGDILKTGTYVIEGDRLRTCADDGGDEEDSPLLKALILIGQLGTGVSIISLSLYLVIYTLVPTMRNLPGYNLTSLSAAFLMAYCFVLIGQIPSVLGVSCVISASLEHFFFLAGFLWMNVISFDVWRALTLAIRKLVAPTGKVGKLRFLCYSLYAWGIPLWLAIAVVSLDYFDEISDEYKPLFGHYDRCWFNNEKAKIIFFVGPVFFVLIVNAVFFILSAFMIVTNMNSMNKFHSTRSNTMKESNELQIAAKRNFVLYGRLALIMGVPWLMVIIGVLVEKEELWMIFDTINSLQGLFIFLLFSCSRKTWNHIRNGSNRFVSRDSSKSSTLKNSATFRSESQYSRK